MKDKTRINDLTGRKFDKLKVIRLEETGTRKTYWLCECECGNTKLVRSDNLLCGTIRSCGCLKKTQDRINLTANHSHKQSGKRIYHIWQNMKSRCYNINNKCYCRYGKRGITVCDEWKNNFQAFYDWSMRNGYTEELTIDRINVDGNYEPNNCRWATTQQQNNNRSTTIKLTYNGETKSLTEWCKFFNSNYRSKKQKHYKQPDISFEELFELS